MEKNQVLSFWRGYFADLFIGTFKNLLLSSTLGLLLGALAVYMLKDIEIEPQQWSGWLEALALTFAVAWYGAWGFLHGILAGILHTVNRKLREMIGGLHDLLDILVSGVLNQYPRFNKNIPKEELAEKFDQIGKKFLDELRLKGGIFNWFKGLVFRVILKALKFLFLDDVREELLKKPGEQLTRADIESAVRRVGVEFVVSTISDNILFMHCLNGVAMVLTFGLPFALFWVF